MKELQQHFWKMSIGFSFRVPLRIDQVEIRIRKLLTPEKGWVSGRGFEGECSGGSFWMREYVPSFQRRATIRFFLKGDYTAEGAESTNVFLAADGKFSLFLGFLLLAFGLFICAVGNSPVILILIPVTLLYWPVTAVRFRNSIQRQVQAVRAAREAR